MSVNTEISYPHLARALAAAGGDVSPAEAHGLLLGLMCTEKEDVHGLWLDELIDASDVVGDVLVTECISSLRKLADMTHQQLDDENFELELLLPDDDQPMKERASAILDWVQGFLYGLGLGGQKFMRVLSGDEGLKEGVKDLTELTKMDVDALDETDESQETALFELSEYVRVIVLTARENKLAQGNVHE